ncbi:MAG: hypothetical protein A3K14_00285 [Sulfurimonas sp. RIFCSPLOWO2_12_FULL_36_74]|nr:MAG: hypothetical protein A3J26_01770 [Sulfurimonas sp. RIFCSPLOWO2_02_FULL_36_28]OHE07342.1 MAG: hypothetical protein A3K14_00285 [Sulfurimonas sp. RIFCSPLOWO2_12_FULL_36_74]
MIIIKAKLFGVYISSDFTKEDGTVVIGKPKLQLLGEVTLKNGEKKSELLDISIPKEKLNLYKDKIGSTVEVEVGVIGKCSYYGI